MRKAKKFLLVVIVVAVVAFVIIPAVKSYYSEKTYVGTVTDKTVKNYYEGNNAKSKFLVFVDLQDGKSRVFSVEDTLIKGRINSADDYGRLKVNKTYKFYVIGWRIPLFSQYENIVKFDKID